MSEWKLVPVEPTEAMLIDGTRAATGWMGTTGATYRAMLAAAPAPTVTDEMVERAARAIDPDAWASDIPIPTRGHVLDFHARRQQSCARARAALTAALGGQDE